jgi:hypothetical protein
MIAQVLMLLHTFQSIHLFLPDFLAELVDTVDQNQNVSKNHHQCAGIER